MSGASPLVWAGSAATVAAILLLRHSWSLPRRSTAQNAAAWALLLAGTVLGVAGDGAWGAAIVSLVAMGAAAFLLMHAAATARAGKTRASNRKAHILPEAGEPRRIGGRLATFAITGPFAMIASLFVALGARALAALAGWVDADSNALALLLVPLVWAMLAFVLMMLPNRRAQLAWLAMPTLTGLGLICSLAWIGGAA